MRRFLRYVLVGVVATGVHYAILVAWVEIAGWPAWSGAGVGAVVGAQVAFVGNRALTFMHRGRLLASWWRFQATAAVGALTAVVTVGMAQRIGWHYLVGQVVATGLATLLTYAINRRWSFAPTRDRA